ncbi:sugar ABC transporter substrate-binding protein, partial [Arthrobacter sp. TS-15]
MRRSSRGGRRSAAAVAVSAVLALTATACGDDGSGSAGDKGADGSGKGKVVFWDNNGGVRTDIWKEIIADFEKENPDIEVEYVGIAATEYQSKVDTALQGGGLPDVGGVGAAMLAGFAAQNALEPLDSRLGKSSLNGKLNEDMVKSLKAAGGRDDTLYSIPTSANNGVLYYRTDLFKQAGLDEPTTWDNFYEAADKLTDKGKNEFGYTIRGGAGSIAQALDAMYGQSGITSFWDSGNEKTTVNDPKNVAALEKYVGLFKKVTPAADLNNDFTKMVAQWDSGTIGMLNHNLGSYQDHVKALGVDKFRGIPQPVGPGGKRVQVSNPVDGLGLFKSSKNKDAAWKFIDFATSKAENSKFNEAAGQVPSNNDAAKDAWVSKAEPTRL